MSKKSHEQKLKRKLKQKQRVQTTSRSARLRQDRATYDRMVQSLTNMPPDTIMHVGEQLVMTDAELQRHIAEVTEGATEIGLTGEGGIDDPRTDLQAMARMSLGLNQTMTASELLAALERNPPM